MFIYNTVILWSNWTCYYCGFYWPLWQPEWGIFLIWTGSGPPHGLAENGRRGYWYKHTPLDTGSPPRHQPLSWSPQKPESVSPSLQDREHASDGKYDLCQILYIYADIYLFTGLCKNKWFFFFFTSGSWVNLEPINLDVIQTKMTHMFLKSIL